MKTLIARFRRWFDRENELRTLLTHRRGYNWAAGCLLRGTAPQAVLNALDHNDPIAFDTGARHACRDFLRLQSS